MNNKAKNNSFLIHGGILALTGVFCRLLGIVRRVPLANIIGDSGNAFFSAANEIYIIVLMITSYCMPRAVSKVISERLGRREYRNVSRFFAAAMLIAIVLGGFASLFVFIFADVLAGRFMLEPLSALPLKILSPALLIFAVVAVLRGYFQGRSNMIPTAVSQILEEIFMVVSCLIGAKQMYEYGKKAGALLHNDHMAAAYGAAGATIGTVAGAVIALLFMLTVYALNQGRVRMQMAKDMRLKPESYINAGRILMASMLPMLFSEVIYNISSVLDQSIFNHIMYTKGTEELSRVDWGVYTGKYRVLLTVPVAFASAIGTAALPMISKLYGLGGLREVRQKSKLAIRAAMLVVIPATVGLMILARPIMDLLFSDQVELAAKLLQTGGVCMVLLALSSLTTALLQGIDKLKQPLRNSFVSLIIHLLFLWICVAFFQMGIFGVIYSNIVFALSICILNGYSLKKHMIFKLDFRAMFVMPLICSVVMGLAVFLINSLLGKYVGNLFSILICMVVGGFIYLVSIIMSGTLKRNEALNMPLLDKAVPFCDRLHLWR